MTTAIFASITLSESDSPWVEQLCFTQRQNNIYIPDNGELCPLYPYNMGHSNKFGEGNTTAKAFSTLAPKSCPLTVHSAPGRLIIPRLRAEHVSGAWGRKTRSALQSTPCFRKKTSTHIIGYKLRNSCLIVIIFDIKIPHIIWHAREFSCPPHLTNVSTLPCKTYRTSFVAVHYKHALFCDKKLRSTIH